MATERPLTFRDAIDHVSEFLQSNDAASRVTIREAVEQARYTIADEHGWRNLLKPGRVFLKALDSDGTCSYDHTGGVYERYVTLTDTTFPTDAYDYYINIGEDRCAIELYIDATHCTLDVTLNPGADVDADTDCSIYPAWYHLPADFLSFYGPWGESDWHLGTYVDPNEWLALNRYGGTTSGMIERYTIMDAPDIYGCKAMFVDPPSNATESADFIYKRQPRGIRYSGYNTEDTAGTITIVDGSDAVEGDDTSFDEGMINAVLRVGTDATTIPTRRHGLYPLCEERIIRAVTDSENLSLDNNVSISKAGVAYVISDPIDIDRCAQSAFLALCVANVAQMRNFKNKGDYLALYENALRKAKGGDTRVRQRQVMGAGPVHSYRLNDTPVGPDIGG